MKIKEVSAEQRDLIFKNVSKKTMNKTKDVQGVCFNHTEKKMIVTYTNGEHDITDYDTPVEADLLVPLKANEEWQTKRPGHEAPIKPKDPKVDPAPVTAPAETTKPGSAVDSVPVKELPDGPQ